MKNEFKKGEEVICIDNFDYEEDLTLYKIYKVIVSSYKLNTKTKFISVLTDNNEQEHLYQQRFVKNTRLNRILYT